MVGAGAQGGGVGWGGCSRTLQCLECNSDGLALVSLLSLRGGQWRLWSNDWYFQVYALIEKLILAAVWSLGGVTVVDKWRPARRFLKLFWQQRKVAWQRMLGRPGGCLVAAACLAFWPLLIPVAQPLSWMIPVLCPLGWIVSPQKRYIGVLIPVPQHVTL